jgi:hypothetical protein
VNNAEPVSGHEWVVAICEAKGLIQGSHHGRIDLRLDGKIVVNLEDDGFITLKLPLDEQQALLSEYPDYVHLPNGWGQHGWTTVIIEHLDRDVVKELIDISIRTISAPKRRGR